MTDLVTAYMTLSSFLDDYGRFGMSDELARLADKLGMEFQEASDPFEDDAATTERLLFDARGDALNLIHERSANGAHKITLQHWVNGKLLASREWVSHVEA